LSLINDIFDLSRIHRADGAGRIEVLAAPKDGFVEVPVTDTGVGIAPEDQEAVFEEFRQLGTADKKIEGTGLGLSLCRKFVELHFTIPQIDASRRVLVTELGDPATECPWPSPAPSALDLLDSRQPPHPRHPMRYQVPIVAGATRRREGL
jgi:hypothetical protein